MRRFLFLIFILISSIRLFSATATWVGVTGGTWATAANWSTGAVPAPNDSVVINNFIGIISIASTANIASLHIDNSDLTISGAATSLTLATTNGAISYISTNSTVTLNITNLTILLGTTFNIDGTLICGASSAKLVTTSGVTNVNGLLKSIAGSGNPTTDSANDLVFGPGGVYEIAKNGGTVPLATYDPESFVKSTGAVANGPTWNAGNTSYGHIIWNNPSQSAASSLNVNFSCTSLTVLSTGASSEIRLTSGTNPITWQIEGDLEIATGTRVNLSNGAANGILKVKGLVTIAGQITEGGSSTGSGIELNGALAQDLIVEATGTIINTVALTINNPNNVVVVNDVTLPHTLNFTSGSLILNEANLFVNNNAVTAITGASPVKYVITNGTGALKRKMLAGTNYEFPIGTESELLNVTINNSGAADDFSARAEIGLPSCISAYDAESVDITFDIAEASPGGSNVALTLDYGATAVGGSYLPANAQIVHCDSPTTYDFHNGSVTGNIAMGSGFTSFSPFGITSSLVVLPIKLKSFDVTTKDHHNHLLWTTASEVNNDYFDVLRSKDGRNFSSLGRIEGAGNSMEENSYKFVDNTPNDGINYYQFKQVDFDGNYTFSPIVSVKNTMEKNFTITPSTFENDLTIRTGIASYDVKVYDESGRMVSSFKNLSGNQNIDLVLLKNGCYFMNIVSDTLNETVKIVKL